MLWHFFSWLVCARFQVGLHFKCGLPWTYWREGCKVEGSLFYWWAQTGSAVKQKRMYGGTGFYQRVRWWIQIHAQMHIQNKLIIGYLSKYINKCNKRKVTEWTVSRLSLEMYQVHRCFGSCVQVEKSGAVLLFSVCGFWPHDVASAAAQIEDLRGSQRGHVELSRGCGTYSLWTPRPLMWWHNFKWPQRAQEHRYNLATWKSDRRRRDLWKLSVYQHNLESFNM